MPCSCASVMTRKNNLRQAYDWQNTINSIVERTMRGMIMRYHEIIETTKPAPPLTTTQLTKRRERDRKRQERIRSIQATAAQDIADITPTIGR